MSYRIDFVKHHLIAGVYCVDHEFVHKLLNEFYKLNLENQNQILHYRQKIKEKDDEKPLLYWATKQRQQNIMTDIVRAEYIVHKAIARKDLNTNLNTMSLTIPRKKLVHILYVLFEKNFIINITPLNDFRAYWLRLFSRVTSNLFKK